jgi:probable HAF family extracellular repeat protein
MKAKNLDLAKICPACKKPLTGCRSFSPFLTSACLLALSLTASALAASFQGLGDLPGGIVFSVATGVSADGKFVVGYSSSTLSGTTSYEAFRWSAETGMVPLGDLPGGTYTSFAQAISADGATVVGHSRASSGDQAFRWTQATGMVGLGYLPGGSLYSLASAVSADGSIIAGESRSGLSGTRREAFRWTPTDGMVGLGDLPGGDFNSVASGISADGSVIVGDSSSSNGNQAFRWTEATGLVGLGDLDGGIFNSVAYGVSADGSTVVGYGTPDNSGTHEVFRWTAGMGMVGLGFLPCSDWTIARAVSGDGSIIVGDPQTSSYKCVFIWDSQRGLRELQSVLTSDYGLDLTGWKLGRATAITDDGNTIVGYGSNPSGQTEAWIATGLKPVLTIRKTNDTCWLSWPASAADFILQSSDNLTAGWSNMVVSVITNGSSVSAPQNMSGNMRFYRLSR